MQTYRCTCGNRLYFENTCCLACQREVGWCEACNRLVALEPVDAVNGTPPTTYRCGHEDCGQALCKCHNYAVENICNHCYMPDNTEASVPSDQAGQGDALMPNNPTVQADPNAVVAPVAPVNRLCVACQLTTTIPDLTIAGNREKWARLEASKRRLLYTLDRIGLPYADVQPKLTFDFKADIEHPNNEWRQSGPAEIIYTGHADGKITINIREADDAFRESLRCQFHEAQRTLIGHFHHEVGHYYWQLLVQNQREKECIRVFGDHNAPPYAESMAAYYENGPREGWNLSFISAYASSHPWEDFAETFGLYLDMISVLDTASNLFKSINANLRSRSVSPLIERFHEVGILVNEFNRTMGLLDLVPEVIVTPVAEKLEFIHSLVKRAARPPRIEPLPTPPLLSV